jgi:condensin complex subunit 3
VRGVILSLTYVDVRHSEEIYAQLRDALRERVYDKESVIRVHAVHALAKLCGSEDPTDINEGEPTVLETLIDILKYDTSAEVRRAAVHHIPLSPASLPHFLTRTRDIDSAVRKLVYSAILEANCHAKDDSKMAGFTHPRTLTIATREMIVRHGLGDREPTVRIAAVNLLVTWIEVVRSSEEIVKSESGARAIEEDILAFLRLFDLADNTVADDALLSIFKSRVDLFENVKFEDNFWQDLTPEKAFFARVFVDHCIELNDNARLESTLPVVTSFAFKIQERYNELLASMQDEEEEQLLRLEERDDDRARREEERMDHEFVIGEMLKLAVNLDYADEIGRRKMFQLVRDMISQEALPESLVAKCLDILRKLSASERDLIRVVVEVVHELRDPQDVEEDVSVRDLQQVLSSVPFLTLSQKEFVAEDEDTSFAESSAPKRVQPARQVSPSQMTQEEKAKSDAMDIRCLSLCIGMLERVNSASYL